MYITVMYVTTPADECVKLSRLAMADSSGVQGMWSHHRLPGRVCHVQYSCLD